MARRWVALSSLRDDSPLRTTLASQSSTSRFLAITDLFSAKYASLRSCSARELAHPPLNAAIRTFGSHRQDADGDATRHGCVALAIRLLSTSSGDSRRSVCVSTSTRRVRSRLPNSSIPILPSSGSLVRRIPPASSSNQTNVPQTQAWFLTLRTSSRRSTSLAGRAECSPLLSKDPSPPTSLLRSSSTLRSSRFMPRTSECVLPLKPRYSLLTSR